LLTETAVQDALSDLGVVQGLLGFRQHLEDGLWLAGKLRLEGKEYVMQDGDVVEFRFNV
jgi:ribosome-binding ATPase YchF (GTP1/OBG family)